MFTEAMQQILYKLDLLPILSYVTGKSAVYEKKTNSFMEKIIKK